MPKVNIDGLLEYKAKALYSSRQNQIDRGSNVDTLKQETT